jgi:hypothetical protein
MHVPLASKAAEGAIEILKALVVCGPAKAPSRTSEIAPAPRATPMIQHHQGRRSRRRSSVVEAISSADRMRRSVPVDRRKLKCPNLIG